MLSLCTFRNCLRIKHTTKQIRSVYDCKFAVLRFLPNKETKPPHNLIPTFPNLSPPPPKRWYSTISYKLADIGEGISEVEILEWYVKEGSKVNQFDPLCEVQSDKATVTITCRFSGILEKIFYEVGDMAKVGSPLCDIKVDESSNTEPKDAPDPPTPPKLEVKPSVPPKQETPLEPTNTITTAKGTQKIFASPAVRYLAKKNSVNLSGVTGSGKDGRVTKGDLLQYINTATTQTQPTMSTPLEVQKTTGTMDGLEIKEVIVVRGFAKGMAQSMAHSLTIPHLGYSDEVFMDSLMKFRDSLKPIAAARGIKLSYMPFLIKAASLAMKKYPILNARINNELTEITLISNHNIAVAVSTPQGLVVPNIKNVQDLSIFEISERLSQIIEKAQNNKLSVSDLQGSTITISNIGVIGGTYASPVLVNPQVCIVALGKVHKVPRFNMKNKVVPVHVMNVSWSADHRVIDGATIANFSNLWKKYLEEPTSMLLDTK